MLHIRNLEEGVELFKVLGSDIRVNIILLLLKEKEMNMNEIATAVRCGRPLIEIVLNNHVLGMVRQWQTLFYDHRYSHTILNDAVDFVKLAEAMGAKAIRITKMEEVEPALKEALACPGPIVLDCMIDQDLSVFPMVPAGASIDDIFDEEDMKNNEQSV